MEQWQMEMAKDYYRTMEKGISRLTPEGKAEVYMDCAVRCVKDMALVELRRQFEECDRDLDKQYTKYGRSEYFFADIIEPGHVYEIGYPRCLCPLVDIGLANSAEHCECSRQSIIYVMKELKPESKVTVETLKTVLSGAEECRFRVTVD